MNSVLASLPPKITPNLPTLLQHPMTGNKKRHLVRSDSSTHSSISLGLAHCRGDLRIAIDTAGLDLQQRAPYIDLEIGAFYIE